MSRQSLQHVGKRQIARAWETKATEAKGMMSLLTAILAHHGGRLVLDIERIEETPRMVIQTFIDPDTRTVIITAETKEIEVDEHGALPPDPRSARQRLANRLIR